MTNNAKLITPNEASKIIGVTIQCLAFWRSNKKGPPYAKLEGKIMYDKEKLNNWIEFRSHKFDL